MRTIIITPNTVLQTIDGIVSFKGYNGHIFHGTIQRDDLIEDEAGELVTNPNGDGLTPPVEWMASKPDLEHAIASLDGRWRIKVRWDDHIYTADSETGTIIDCADSVEEAEDLIREYEEDDKANGVFTEDFYDIIYVDRTPVER